jgi:hypothetical protein
MDMDFVIKRLLVRHSRLLFGSCSSARTFAPRFLQTLPRDNALALCYPSPPSGWRGTFTLKYSNMLGTRFMLPPATAGSLKSSIHLGSKPRETGTLACLIAAESRAVNLRIAAYGNSVFKAPKRYASSM